jgi:hypothetical protein
MRPDPASASAKMESTENRHPKMHEDAFSVGARYHALGKPATLAGVELARALTP